MILFFPTLYSIFSNESNKLLIKLMYVPHCIIVVNSSELQCTGDNCMCICVNVVRLPLE